MSHDDELPFSLLLVLPKSEFPRFNSWAENGHMGHKNSPL